MTDMTEEQIRIVVGRFLLDCPEWRDEVNSSGPLLLMSSGCTKAFGNWAVERGLAKPERAAHLRRMIEEVESGKAGGQ